MRSNVDRPGVKPFCYGRCFAFFAKIVSFIRPRHIMWVKTLAGTDRSDIPLYLLQSDDRIMAMFQSVGIAQYLQMSVKRGSSKMIMGAPPAFSRSSDVMPQIPGARPLYLISTIRKHVYLNLVSDNPEVCSSPSNYVTMWIMGWIIHVRS